MGVRLALASAALLLALAACAPPIAVDQAEAICAGQVQTTVQPTTSVGVGFGSGGQTAVGVGMTFGSASYPPPTPAAAYATCVRQKSGQPPSRPYASLMTGQP